MKTEQCMKIRVFGLLLFLSAILPITMNAEGKRYALIIGNSKYESDEWQQLKSPELDVNLMSAVFLRLGFEIYAKRNLKKDAMLDALNEFCKRLDENDTVVFYYSGHGKNYCKDYVFVPVDSVSKKYGNNQNDIDANYVKLNDVTKIIGAKCRFSIFFIDACRDGNSESEVNGVWAGGVKGRNQVDLQSDSTKEQTFCQYICYATQNDNTVPDKDGHGYFAEVLSEKLFEAKKDFLKVWDIVKKEVDKKTNAKQVPADVITIGSSVRFCFNGSGEYLPLDKKYVIFEAEPNNAEIILLKDSKNPKSSERVYRSGQKYVFDSGELFNYEVKCSGYIPEKGTLKITDTLSVPHEFHLKKSENAVLHVVSDKTKNAKVYLDGQYVGSTPCDIHTFTGPHDIRLESRLRYDYSKHIMLDSTDMHLPVTLDYRTPSYFDWDEYSAHHISYHFSPKYQLSLNYMYRVDGYNVTRLSYGLILGFSPGFFKGMSDSFSQSVSVDVSTSTSVSIGGVPIGGESEEKRIYDTSSMEYSSFVDPYGIAKYYDSNALALANVGFNACNGIVLEAGIGAAWHRDKYYMENTYEVIETIKGEESPIYDYLPQSDSHLYKGKVKCSPAIRLGVNFMIPFNRDYDFGLTIGGGYIYLPMNHRSSSWDASLGFIWSY